jgi:hypothetical protein
VTPERRDARTRGPLTELTLARIRELTREPEAVFWVFVFPILLAAVLGLAFRSRPPEALPVAVVAGPQADARQAALASQPDLKTQVLPETEARTALSRGRVVLVVSADDPPVYAYDAPHGWPWTPRCSAPPAGPTCSPHAGRS